MSFRSRDPGVSRFAVPTAGELVKLLDESAFRGDLIFHGGDLSPQTLLAAYSSGLFPMPLDGNHLGWFCPAQRGVFLTGASLNPEVPVRVSRSLKKSMARFTYSMNLAFEEVITGCANPERSGSWITTEFISAYLELHELGWAHSFEVWSQDGVVAKLVGGLYGVAIGGLFAGESMFHNVTDASKAALATLASKMAEQGGILIDTQWNTDHLASLGATTMPRIEYLNLLDNVTSMPLPDMFEKSYAGPISMGR